MNDKIDLNINLSMDDNTRAALGHIVDRATCIGASLDAEVDLEVPGLLHVNSNNDYDMLGTQKAMLRIKLR